MNKKSTNFEENQVEKKENMALFYNYFMRLLKQFQESFYKKKIILFNRTENSKVLKFLCI